MALLVLWRFRCHDTFGAMALSMVRNNKTAKCSKMFPLKKKLTQGIEWWIRPTMWSHVYHTKCFSLVRDWSTFIRIFHFFFNQVFLKFSWNIKTLPLPPTYHYWRLISSRLWKNSTSRSYQKLFLHFSKRTSFYNIFSACRKVRPFSKIERTYFEQSLDLFRVK